METTIERLKAKTIIDPATDCWLWQASIMKRNGYGQFWLDGVNMTAHRASYMIHKGPIPPGGWILHTCDVKTCVNPDHLYLGNRRDNARDAKVRGQTARGQDHGLAKLTEQQAIAIRADPRYADEIAKDYPVSRGLILAIKSGRAWKHLTAPTVKNEKPKPAGEQNHLAKLTEKEVRAIVADKRSRKTIAAQYKVSKSLVTAIKNKKVWKHLWEKDYANTCFPGVP